MDIEKEKEAFESWFESRYDAHFMQFALDLDMYADKHTQTCWEAWQAAKAESHKSASLYQLEINHLASANQQLRDYAAKAQAVPEVLKKFCNEHKDPAWRGRVTEYDKGYSDCCIAVLELIEAQEPAND